jgi:hypothetical protein
MFIGIREDVAGMNLTKSIVIFAIAILAILMAVLAYINFRGKKADDSYPGSALAAEAAINEAIELLNKQLDEHLSEIDEAALRSFTVKRFANRIIDNYIVRSNDEFHLVGSPISRREDLLEEERRAQGIAYLKSLDLSSKDFNGEAEVTVAFDETGAMAITAKAGDAELSAAFAWIDFTHEELIEPAFEWGSMPEPFGFALSSAGKVFFNGDEAGPNEPYLLSFSEWLQTLGFANGGGMPDVAWTEGNPITIGRSLNVDASYLYDSNGKPIPTCIICLESDLILYASQSSRSEFKGVVLSLGGLQLLGVSFEGTALSLNDAYVYPGMELPKADPEMLFKVGLADWNYTVLMIDAFTGSSLLKGKGEMGGRLKHAAISESSPVYLRPSTPIRLERISD